MARLFCLALLLCLDRFASGAAPLPRPLASMFTTCAGLNPSLYPADTTTWFDAARHPQIVFYAHLLFPLVPGQDAPHASTTTAGVDEPWHPPMAIPTPAPSAPEGGEAMLAVNDAYFASADWLDPDGGLIAQYGLTMPARVSTDYVKLSGRQYIPHTFTMTVGTKDIRDAAGQKMLPAKSGQYHIRFYVGGELEGIAFFRMLSGAQPGGQPLMVSPRASVTQGVKKEEAAARPPLEDIWRALSTTAR